MSDAHSKGKIGRSWNRIPARFDSGIGSVGAIGVIALASDRVGVWDLERFLAPVEGLAIFSTRVPVAPIVTPGALAAMHNHLTEAARLLVPGSLLDAVAFSCTSGTVAIGPQAVHAAIHSVRPEVRALTPMEAADRALRTLGCHRLALLTPYHPKTADLVAGYFEDKGFELTTCCTFDLDGDVEMNRVSSEALIEAAAQCMVSSPYADGLFISCTGLRTSPIIERLESAIGKPVVTSNQALAWDVLRAIGGRDVLKGSGRLFLAGR